MTASAIYVLYFYNSYCQPEIAIGISERDDQMTGSNYRGWLIVVLCFTGLSLAMTSRALLGLTIPIWESEFGWSRSFISIGSSVTLIVTALISPVSGNLIDRFGPGTILSFGAVAVGAGIGLTATMHSQWQFLFYFGVLAAVGFGSLANHTVSTTVAYHFRENRGLATGAATAGSTAGQLVIVPLLALGMTSLGWRTSVALLGFSCVILAPILFILFGRHNRAFDSRGDGSETLAKRLKFLLSSMTFHALFWSFFICGFTTVGVIEVHLIPYAVTCGFAPLTSATAYATLSGFNMVGMIGSGWLTDRVSRPALLGSIYFARSVCFVLLLYIGDDVRLLFLFALAFGIFDFSTVPPTASLAASQLGVRVMGLAMGLIYAAHAAGGALSASLGGYFFDRFAGYGPTWMMCIPIAFSAGIIVLLIPETRAYSARPSAA